MLSRVIPSETSMSNQEIHFTTHKTSSFFFQKQFTNTYTTNETWLIRLCVWLANNNYIDERNFVAALNGMYRWKHTQRNKHIETLVRFLWHSYELGNILLKEHLTYHPQFIYTFVNFFVVVVVVVVVLLYVVSFVSVFFFVLFYVTSNLNRSRSFPSKNPIFPLKSGF